MNDGSHKYWNGVTTNVMMTRPLLKFIDVLLFIYYIVTRTEISIIEDAGSKWIKPMCLVTTGVLERMVSHNAQNG